MIQIKSDCIARVYGSDVYLEYHITNKGYESLAYFGTTVPIMGKDIDVLIEENRPLAEEQLSIAVENILNG